MTRLPSAMNRLGKIGRIDSLAAASPARWRRSGDVKWSAGRIETRVLRLFMVLPIDEIARRGRPAGSSDAGG